VAAAVADDGGLPRHRLVEIVPVNRTPFRQLGVVVLVADHPVSRRRRAGLLAHRVLDGGDAPQIDVRAGHLARSVGVAVGVDEARQDGGSAPVDQLCPRPRQRADVVVRSHRQDPVAGQGNGFGLGLRIVHRVDPRPGDQYVCMDGGCRLGGVQGSGRQEARAQPGEPGPGEEFTPRR
jgi:hypothetical protein